MSVLVVGGAGYIGSHTAKALAASGREVAVLDNLSTGHEEFLRWGEFVRADILDDPASLAALLAERGVKAVMHFASLIQVGESMAEPGSYYRTNLCGVLNLLEGMRNAGVDKLIFSSSAAVYGNPRSVPLTEDHPLLPINPYGWTKRMAEQMMADFGAAHGLRSVSLRYFNAAGASADGEIGEWHDPESHLIPIVLDAALGRREHVAVYGDDYDTPDGTCVRDFIHVEDLAEAHLLALERLEEGGESAAYNLGVGSGRSVLEVIETVRGVTGRPVEVVTADRRPGDPPRLVASSSRAESELGWRPVKGLEEMVESAWKWHRNLHHQG
ncbi:UDP-glucose 4-epimerase GalE [Desulfohalovibrio reitneri]|uniref:UDP-glucose 4-epimerase GalE n=1 Tax=Desulfohalovibrio reitneri TaxID=1307759 RepID=UPI0004A71418|nr:UDP-glucose 4-epimerase GalE [Desulfohalovibrio reitneri]